MCPFMYMDITKLQNMFVLSFYTSPYRRSKQYTASVPQFSVWLIIKQPVDFAHDYTRQSRQV